MCYKLYSDKYLLHNSLTNLYKKSHVQNIAHGIFAISVGHYLLFLYFHLIGELFSEFIRHSSFTEPALESHSATWK